MNATQTNQGVAKILRSLAEGLVLIADDMAEVETKGKAALSNVTTSAGRKAKPPVEVDVEESLLEFGRDAETETAEDSFLTDDEEPVKAKPKKAAKLTDTDVNEAAMAHARANGGKAKTLSILNKKFKVKSILELKPDQYAAVIAALEV